MEKESGEKFIIENIKSFTLVSIKSGEDRDTDNVEFFALI